MSAKSDATNSVKTQKPKEPQEQTFLVGKLREKSMTVFGISKSTFDGAFFGHEKEDYTITEAKAIIDKWLGKE